MQCTFPAEVPCVALTERCCCAGTVLVSYRRAAPTGSENISQEHADQQPRQSAVCCGWFVHGPVLGERRGFCFKWNQPLLHSSRINLPAEVSIAAAAASWTALAHACPTLPAALEGPCCQPCRVSWQRSGYHSCRTRRPLRQWRCWTAIPLPMSLRQPSKSRGWPRRAKSFSGAGLSSKSRRVDSAGLAAGADL